MNTLALSRRTLTAAAIGAALVGLGGAALAADSMTDAVAGVYRGTLTTGDKAGTRIVITVYAKRDDRVSLLSNNTIVPDNEIDVKMDGDNLVQQGGDVAVTFKTKAAPIELEYTPKPGVTFVGKKI